MSFGLTPKQVDSHLQNQVISQNLSVNNLNVANKFTVSNVPILNVLTSGDAGQVLTAQGPGTVPIWQTPTANTNPYVLVATYNTWSTGIGFNYTFKPSAASRVIASDYVEASTSLPDAYVIKIAGTYMINASLQANFNVNLNQNYFNLYIQKNGVNETNPVGSYSSFLGQVGQLQPKGNMCGSMVMDLNVNDEITFLFNNASTSLSSTGTNAVFTASYLLPPY